MGRLTKGRAALTEKVGLRFTPAQKGAIEARARAIAGGSVQAYIMMLVTRDMLDSSAELLSPTVRIDLVMSLLASLSSPEQRGAPEPST